MMVWTVLTWIRDMAILEKICPPTWKTPIGNVASKTALVGQRSLENRTTGLMKSRQYPATNPNWMKVRVTGYRNVVIIDFPVLDERAEVVYQLVSIRWTVSLASPRR